MGALVLPIPNRDRAPSADEQARVRVVFFRVAPAMFIGTLDQAIVAAALPAIATDLADFADVAWLVTAYLLAATVAATRLWPSGFGAIFALASALGPVAGGPLSQSFGWRSIFWVNVPLESSPQVSPDASTPLRAPGASLPTSVAPRSSSVRPSHCCSR